MVPADLRHHAMGVHDVRDAVRAQVLDPTMFSEKRAGGAAQYAARRNGSGCATSTIARPVGPRDAPRMPSSGYPAAPARDTIARPRMRRPSARGQGADMIRPRRLLAITVLLTLSAGPTAATAVHAQEVRVQERVLRTTIATDIRGLMPGMSPDVFTGTVLQQVYEGLVVSRADGTVVPMFAETAEASADGLTWTFTLRTGVRFHNGAPLTSAEVVWTWRQFLDPQRPFVCRTSFDGTRALRIVGIEALDPRRVAFRLARPFPAFLAMMARPDCEASIAHPDSVGADGQWSRAIGTGPFRLAEWRRGQFVDLVRNPDYAARSEPADGYAGAKEALVDRLRFTIIPDPAAARAALTTGDLDVWPQIEPSYLAEFRANPRLRVSVSSLASINTLLFQTNDPVLADPRIRRAINAAIDFAALAESISEGVARPSTSPVPDTTPYFGAVQRAGHRFDLALARRLLAEAGCRGQTIRIATPPRGSMFDTAITVQAMLREAGLAVEVEAMEFGTMLQRNLRGQCQMMVWLYTPYLDPMFLFERFIGDKAVQPDRIWDNPRATALLNDLFAARDGAARQPIYDELHRFFVADAPMIVWSTRYMIAAASARVTGLELAWPGQRVRFWNVGLTGPR